MIIDQLIKKDYAIYQGDCCEVLKDIPDNSIHYSIFSPPFAQLYCYSNSERDMGNSKDDNQFYEHINFLASELNRVIMQGRLISIHCMLLPMFKYKDGHVGLKDFRGDLIKIFQSSGWIFHSEVTIWKCPVVAMQRTKSIRLLHKQLKKDSSMSGNGIADYIVTMRKKGENSEKIIHTNESFPVKVWQKYASPIWTDIRQSDTLQHKSARSEKDERHICPLQLEVIKRCVELWTNPRDIVFSPFAGIGSELYIALRMNRRAMGIELKDTYFEQAIKNCEMALEEEKIKDLETAKQMSFRELNNE